MNFESQELTFLHFIYIECQASSIFVHRPVYENTTIFLSLMIPFFVFVLYGTHQYRAFITVKPSPRKIQAHNVRVPVYPGVNGSVVHLLYLSQGITIV